MTFTWWERCILFFIVLDEEIAAQD